MEKVHRAAVARETAPPLPNALIFERRRSRFLPAGFPAATIAILSVAAVPFLCGPNASAQEESPAVAGEIADGTQAVPLPKPPVPDFEVLETHEQQLPDRKVVFQRVKDPHLPYPRPASLPTGDVGPAQPAPPEIVDLTVAATVVDRRATFLRWIWEGEAYEAWSNADWLLFTGHGECSKGDRLFSTLILASAVDSAALPTDSPLRIPADLPDGPASFRIIKGDPANAGALEAVSLLHERYRNEEPQLRDAFKLRELQRVQREAEEAARRANPPDIVFRYWKPSPEKKLRPAARTAPPQRLPAASRLERNGGAR